MIGHWDDAACRNHNPDWWHPKPPKGRDNTSHTRRSRETYAIERQGQNRVPVMSRATRMPAMGHRPRRTPRHMGRTQPGRTPTPEKQNRVSDNMFTTADDIPQLVHQLVGAASTLDGADGGRFDTTFASRLISDAITRLTELGCR